MRQWSAVVVVATLMSALPIRGGEVIWEDGFEGALGSNWSISGDGVTVIRPSSLALDGTGYLNFDGPSGVDGNSQSTATLNIPLPSGGPTLEFEGGIKVHSGLEAGDSFLIETSSDGKDWATELTILGPVSSGDWSEFSFSLDPSVEYVRFVSEFNSATDRVLLDSLRIVPEPITLVLAGLGSLVLFRHRFPRSLGQ